MWSKNLLKLLWWKTDIKTLQDMKVFPNTLTSEQACQTKVSVKMRCRALKLKNTLKYRRTSLIVKVQWQKSCGSLGFLWYSTYTERNCQTHRSVMTRNVPLKLLSPNRKLQANYKYQPTFPPNFEKKSKEKKAVQAVLTVSVNFLFLLWSNPEERVCLPERVWVWGRGGNFLSKLETKWVTEFSLSRLQSTRSRKSCHTIPPVRWKKKRKRGTA